MGEFSSQRNPVEALAEEFLARYRRGERPALTEYTQAHPDLADEIRDLFPALVLMEEAGPRDGGRVTADGRPPQRLGEYRILREVGRGGMGVVYEAEQEALGRHVALKVLPYELAANPVRLERFRREARSAARLHHTNIVPVFDVGACQGVHYYAMQFIQGQSLDEILHELRRMRTRAGVVPPAEAGAESLAEALVRGVPPGGPSDPIKSHSHLSTPSHFHYYRSVARLGLQAAEALAYAHSQGVLHRDIKPANLLLDLAGTVWVTDFGLAREGESDLTRTGDVVGTLRYMAPERFEGVSDIRSDVYGLGLTLYELLTLQPAFEESDRVRLMDRVAREEPPAPRRRDRRVPRDLETIVLKAIAKEPGRRYATAGDMAEDLRRFLADRPVRARRSMVWERTWRWCRRNPVVAGLSAAVVLLVAVLGIGWFVQGLLREERDKALASQGRAERAERENQIRSHLARAAAYRRSGRVGQRFGALAETAAAMKLDPSPDLRQQLRNEAVAALVLPDLRLVKEWEGWLPGSQFVEFDDAVTRYALVDRQGVVRICGVADGREVCALPSAGGTFPRFSDDGKHIALSSGGRVRVWRLADDGPVLALDEAAPRSFAFSPDSRSCSIGHADGSIALYDLVSGQRLRTLPGDPGSADVAFHPTKPQLAVLTRTGIHVCDLESGATVASFSFPGQAYPAPAWSPDGTLLAAVGADQAVHVWDLRTGAQCVRVDGGHMGGLQIRFDASSRFLVGYSWECILRFWDTRTGKQVLTLPVQGIGHLRVSSGGRLLAREADGPRLQVWEIAPGGEFTPLAFDRSRAGKAPQVCSIHPDGRLLQIGTGDGLEFWDLAADRWCGSVYLAEWCFPAQESAVALLTNSRTAAWRWPITPGVRGPTSSGTPMAIGPPQRLQLPGSDAEIACSRNGSVIASAQYDGAVVWHRDDPDRVVALRPHRDVRMIAVSPDGQWVATGSHAGSEARVWEARTGRLVVQLLRGEGMVNVGFSPEGRWLVTTGGGTRLWRTGTWEEGPKVSSELSVAAFSADGKVLAVATSDSAVRLVDPETGREYARLEHPHQERTTFLAFGPDGARVVGRTEHGMYVWDLRSIRRQLGELGLDWDLPPCPPPPWGDAPSPLQLTINTGPLGAPRNPPQLGAALAINSLALALIPCNAEAAFRRGVASALLENWPEALEDADFALALEPGHVGALYLRGQAHQRLGHHREALADFHAAFEHEPQQVPSLEDLQKALDLDPRSAQAQDDLAWTIVTGPPEKRFPGLALLAAERAVLLAPRNAHFRNTLGVVHYRLGRWHQAIHVLLHTGQNPDDPAAAYDLYVLAMSLHQLGQVEQARRYYDQAVAWRSKGGVHPQQASELAAFRAEAEALLGVTSAPKAEPAGPRRDRP
jgi:serine/threonine protein kinase/WD40 repeat protein/tetratricopeptide (TPR) repeat protein